MAEHTRNTPLNTFDQGKVPPKVIRKCSKVEKMVILGHLGDFGPFYVTFWGHLSVILLMQSPVDTPAHPERFVCMSKHEVGVKTAQGRPR